MPHRVLAFVVTFVCLTAAVRASAAEVRGRISDSSGGALPGVTITLTPEPAGTPLVTVTDAQGVYVVAVPPGRYRLDAELPGFAPLYRTGLTVASEPLSLDLQLALASIAQEVTVTADAPKTMIDDAQPDAPVTVTREVIDSAMLPNSQYDDVLPLMPNVVRGPDGAISVAGARAPQGALFVNGVNETDPIAGGAGFIIPIDAVDSMQVYSGGYPADLGRATGGVTAALTRSGGDAFHMMVDSAFPRLLFGGGGVQGVEFWDPNLGASGPLARGRLFFQQALSYRFDRNSFTTLAGPERNAYDALLSWSQIDARLSSNQHLRLSVGLDPQSTDHASITAFTPAPSMPRLDQGGWNAALSHDATVAHGFLVSLHAAMMRTQSTVTPPAGGAYVVGHDLLDGAYFDRQARQAQRVEVGAAAARTITEHHLAKIGVDVDRATLNDTDNAAPVTLLRSDGSISRVISFLPINPIEVAAVNAGAYVQDTWTPRPWLTIDGGIRYDRTSSIGDPAISPRLAWTVKPTHTMTISGSAGRFADKIPLVALAYPLLPARIIQAFDATGVANAPATVYPNVSDAVLQTPRAERWNFEADQRFPGGLLLRARYEERHGHNELVVNELNPSSPAAPDLFESPLRLDSTGTSLARSFETTVGYRDQRGRGEVYVSYVRARTRGDLNSLDAVEGTFRTPFVQPNVIGPLAADVPNRVLAWGLFHLPGDVTVAPFVDVRDGFPYRAIDENWLYVGSADAFRLPWYGTLDLSVNKIVSLPGHLPAARVGMKFYNLASTHTEREVQRDIARPDFGATYDPIPRDFAMVFEFLWGHHR